MKENVQYKNEALASLKGNWAQAVLGILILLLICYAVLTPMYAMMLKNPTDLQAAAAAQNRFVPLVWIFSIFFINPVQLGYIVSFRVMSLSGDGRVVGNMFRIGLGNYWRHVWAVLLRNIYTVLWSLLLVVPGIIKALSYAMTYYIIEDYPELSVNKSIELSMAMMKGRKYDLFYLYLSLIGWFLLSMLTLGIGLLWFYPYAQACQHAFYQDVKHDYLMRRNAEKAASEYAPAAPASATSAAPAAPASTTSAPQAPASTTPAPQSPASTTSTTSGAPAASTAHVSATPAPQSPASTTPRAPAAPASTTSAPQAPASTTPEAPKATENPEDYMPK